MSDCRSSAVTTLSAKMSDNRSSSLVSEGRTADSLHRGFGRSHPGADDGAGHAGGVVGPAEAAVGAGEDDSALAVGALAQEADRFGGSGARRSTVADADAGGA